MNELAQGELDAPPTPDEICQLAREQYQPVRSFCLFSGGHDSSVLAHRCRDHYDELAHVDTGTAVPGVRQFVEDFAEWIGKPLRVLEARHAFRSMVLGGPSPYSGEDWTASGFPGPRGHAIAYSRLKERNIEALVREAKAEFGTGKQRDKVMLLTGTRRVESARRMRTQRNTHRAKGAQLWVNPILHFTSLDMARYRKEHALPESDVAALIHRSGECNCGAFAADGEREELKAIWPEWFAENIEALEAEAQALGVPRCRWGDRESGTQSRPSEAGPLCGDCQLRIDGS